MRSEHSYRTIVDGGNAGCSQQLFHPIRVPIEIDDCASISEFGYSVEQGPCGRDIELPAGGEVALQFGIDAYGRRFGDRSRIPTEFDNIEKGAGCVPPYDLSHGGCDFSSGQTTSTDDTLPSALPQQRIVVFGVVLVECVERWNTARSWPWLAIHKGLPRQHSNTE